MERVTSGERERRKLRDALLLIDDPQLPDRVPPESELEPGRERRGKPVELWSARVLVGPSVRQPGASSRQIVALGPPALPGLLHLLLLAKRCVYGVWMRMA